MSKRGSDQKWALSIPIQSPKSQSAIGDQGKSAPNPMVYRRPECKNYCFADRWRCLVKTRVGTGWTLLNKN